MFRLLKGGQCYNPANIGKKDVLVAYDKIYRIGDDIPENLFPDIEVIDCRNKIICPGFIDQHLHITGGGGEQGPLSRIPEIMLGDIISAGVTTLVGVLGVDGVTRNITGLLAKARALQAEGITTYIYTGSYGVPTATLMGKPITDISLIDKVIGIGEIAIADYRSSYPSDQLLKELASEAMVGGMLGDKAGVMHIHVGDGKEGLSTLFKLIGGCDFPIKMFVPTHLNRNRMVFVQAMEFARRGGYIDFTAGEKTGKGYSVPDALQVLLDSGISIDNVTVSSDGNGSIQGNNGSDGGVGKVKQLFDDIKSCVLNKGISLDLALRPVTVNVAKVLKLYPRKGTLAAGSDADILVLNEGDLNISTMLIGGEVFINNGKVVRKGKYERSY